MDLPFNTATPKIMHIDMNSCFATIEQQANPLLRNKPIAVAAYTTPNACILAPSYEAKRCGIKVGMPVWQGKLLCKDLIVMPPDPPKYRVAHVQFVNILQKYSPIVIPKSIDEAILDFHNTPYTDLENVGYKIKKHIKDDVGEWISCNVGIAPNRFLAKTAAGLNKPDGLDIITHKNVDSVYLFLNLTDLCGINTRFERRLNNAGIFTVPQFYESSVQKLHKEVFKSIGGYHWYHRLRGYEADSVEFERKSIGHEYSLHKKTANQFELSKILMKMCEKVGRRLRKNNFIAHGIYFRLVYTDMDSFHQSRSYNSIIYSSLDIYKHAQKIMDQQPNPKTVRLMAVGVFDLHENTPHQIELYNPYKDTLIKAMDTINDRYGEFIITTARMMQTTKEAPDRIAFGKMQDLKYDE
ncbi:MAG: DNA polymerase IV [bacterium]|nr:DNA polymerase IV [bacterium]